MALIWRAATSKLDTTALWRALIPTRRLVVETHDALGDIPVTRVVTLRVPKRGRFQLPRAEHLLRPRRQRRLGRVRPHPRAARSPPAHRIRWRLEETYEH